MHEHSCLGSAVLPIDSLGSVVLHCMVVFPIAWLCSGIVFPLMCFFYRQGRIGCHAVFSSLGCSSILWCLLCFTGCPSCCLALFWSHSLWLWPWSKPERVTPEQSQATQLGSHDPKTLTCQYSVHGWYGPTTKMDPKVSIDTEWWLARQFDLVNGKTASYIAQPYQSRTISHIM